MPCIKISCGRSAGEQVGRAPRAAFFGLFSKKGKKRASSASSDVPDAENPEVMTLAQSSSATFIIDDNECTRCAICVERCPSDALWLGRVES